MKAGHERPVDRTAAVVVSRGESFEYRGLSTEVCSPTPLPTKEVPEGTQNLVGEKIGRLTVIGLSKDMKRRWVCRCICGNFVYRRAQTIEKSCQDAACQQCYLMAVSKRQEYIRRTGRERNTAEFLR